MVSIVKLSIMRRVSPVCRRDHARVSRSLCHRSRPSVYEERLEKEDRTDEKLFQQAEVALGSEILHRISIWSDRAESFCCLARQSNPLLDFMHFLS